MGESGPSPQRGIRGRSRARWPALALLLWRRRQTHRGRNRPGAVGQSQYLTHVILRQVKLFRGCARCAPAAAERRDDGAAEIGEVKVWKRGAVRPGIQRADESFQKTPHGVESFAESEMQRAAIRAHDH